MIASLSMYSTSAKLFCFKNYGIELAISCIPGEV